MRVIILTEDINEFYICPFLLCLYSLEKRKEDVSHGGELSDSGSQACNRTDPNVSEGSVQPPTGNEKPEEEDEQDTVVLQLGRTMKDLVLKIVKIVEAAKEEN